MYSKEVYAIYKLMKIKGVGPIIANKIIRTLSFSNRSLYNILENNIENKMLSSLLNNYQIEQFGIVDTFLKEQIIKLEGDNAGFLTFSNPKYPKHLLSCLGDLAPPILCYKGNLDLLKMHSVGFCGSRKASNKGLQVAMDCVKQLAEKEIVIISGHAAGIDQKTHYTALESGGSTIIVLPEGILNFKIRKSFKVVWDWKRVLVISEYLPNASWNAFHAMQRNKTIIGLSNAMILIEAGKNGGSMAAGIKTLEMNKKLYAPIYEGMPDFAVGNQILLKKGAIPLGKSRDTGKANLKNLFNFLDEYISIPTTNNKQLSLLQKDFNF